jgi:hypothetical protein
MLHVCVQRFDVTENLKILAKFLASKRCLALLVQLTSGHMALSGKKRRTEKTRLIKTRVGW